MHAAGPLVWSGPAGPKQELILDRYPRGTCVFYLLLWPGETLHILYSCVCIPQNKAQHKTCFFRPPSTHPDLHEPFPSGHSQVPGICADPLVGALSTSSWDVSAGASKCSYQDQAENQQLFPLLADFAFEKKGIVQLLLSRIRISCRIYVLHSEEHGNT